jgi:DNA modification methylase
MSDTLTDDGTPALARRIELWPIERARPHARNPRTHSARQVQQLAASIAEFGWTNPILVDDDGEVLAGHGRLMAARELGLRQVPVIRLEHLSEAQRRAYLLADNQLALEAGWDEQLLGEELAWLREVRFDLDILGFDGTEMEKLLALVDAEPLAGEDEDEVPSAPAEPLTRPGDLWLLGPHRLLCGEATSTENMARLLDGRQADMAFTDPPYNVAYRGGEHRAIANDDLGEGFEAFLSAACVNIVGATDGAIYIAMSSSELHTLHRAFTTAGGHWSTFVIWAKSSFTLGRADYQRQFEPILYGWREGAQRYWCGARDQGDLWLVDKPARNELHPTMKPVALVERAIRNSSRKGDTVLDPFAGSGSTLVAAEKTGRHARLIELDPAYCDAIVERWQRFTGRQAQREG